MAILSAKTNFSVLVSDTLDNIGYSREIVQYRRSSYQIATERANKQVFPDCQISCLQVGSKGEGLTAYAESDIDNMLVLNEVVCYERSCRKDYQLRNTMFETDKEYTAPGYTKLRLSRIGNGMTMKGHARSVTSSLVRTDSGSYISSDAFFDTMVLNRNIRNTLPKQGPSSPSKYLGLSQDLVYSFRCYCPSILSKWLKRNRSNSWPSEHITRKVSTLDAHVVPVGFKLSVDKSLEWRICYTMAEMSLIQSLNDVQTKVYVLLKHIAKSVLKPTTEAVTSYVMKNVIMWVSELTPARFFTNELLIDRLVQSVILLSKFIKQGHVPSYMIPERNLVLGKLSKKERTQLVTLLEELIDEGGSVLFRCDELRLALLKMYKTPEEARQEGERRDITEKSQLMQNTRITQLLITPAYSLNGVVFPVRQNQECGDHQVHAMSAVGTGDTMSHDIEVDAADVTLNQQIIYDPDERELRQLGKNVGNIQWKKLKKPTALSR